MSFWDTVYSMQLPFVCQSNPRTRLSASNLRTTSRRPMRRSALPWIILATVAVSAALAWFTLTRGGVAAGRAPPVEHHELAPFHELEVGGAAEVLLVQGTAEAIDVDDVGHATVEANVSKGRLVIRARDRRRWWSRLFGHETSHAPTITLHVRNLDRLLLTGTVKVAAPRLKAKSLRIG